MIGLEGVSASFGDVAAVSDVSLSVDRGEFVGLVGPNGAGKTTLLRVLNGSLAPDSGVVSVQGDALANLSSREAARRIAAVPQDTSVQFAFDVETVVAMGRTPHRSRFGSDPDAQAYVDRALERTEIEHLRKRRVSEISGGERQRVFLARALAQDAPALVLDEPTASLDIKHAARTLSLIRDLVDEGRGALAAIHDLEAAARYCDRIVLLADGRVVDRGAPEAVLTTDAIDATFETHSAVTTNPVTDAPAITALPAPADRDGRVHVLGGGQVGARVLSALWSAGYEVTAGPLPRGDATVSVAQAFGVDVFAVPGLARPDGETLDRARDAIATADALVLADVDLTPGTPILDLASGVERVALIEERSLEERDHSGVGERRAYRRLRERGVAGDADAVLATVGEAIAAERITTAD